MTDSPLLPVKDALDRILSDFAPLPTEPVDLFNAVGRVLAQDVVSASDLPPFDNSSMDGFALHAADRPNSPDETDVTVKVIGDIPAGVQPTLRLQPGQAARIMTGAPLPEGADCVVPVEDTDFPYRESRALPDSVRIRRFPAAGVNVRPHGQDALAHQPILHTGQLLSPPAVALLATLGLAEVAVHRLPRVAILSTGDELVQPGQPLMPGQIYESNSWMISGLAVQAGAIPLQLGVAADQPEAIRSRLNQAIDTGVNLILTSAGVSVGVYDYVRQVIEEDGQLNLWRVNMRPGKPLAYGVYHGTPLIGLPGNPVSAYVGFMVFVAPAIQRMIGLPAQPRNLRRARLEHAVTSDGRESYLRVQVKSTPHGLTAALVAHQGSGNLLSIVRANALLIIPSGVKSLPAGTEAEIWLMSDPYPEVEA
ncbi:MAG TPA: gephyrin-like molybdotransferase Glp [Bellilinea sp.]|nr:gephyrin-like molybdotransferase Glp [Bellilinea sp.]